MVAATSIKYLDAQTMQSTYLVLEARLLKNTSAFSYVHGDLQGDWSKGDRCSTGWNAPRGHGLCPLG
jgi:hypothetical protein